MCEVELDIIAASDVTSHIPKISWRHRDAVDKSSSQTWGVRPDSSVSSSVVLQGCRTCCLLRLPRGSPRSGEALRHSWGTREDTRPRLLDAHCLPLQHMDCLRVSYVRHPRNTDDRSTCGAPALASPHCQPAAPPPRSPCVTIFWAIAAVQTPRCRLWPV